MCKIIKLKGTGSVQADRITINNNFSSLNECVTNIQKLIDDVQVPTASSYVVNNSDVIGTTISEALNALNNKVQYVKQAKVTLSNAVLMNLFDTPIQALPTLNVGLVYIIHKTTVKVNFNSVTETTNAGQSLDIFYNNNNTVIGSVVPDTLKNSIESQNSNTTASLTESDSVFITSSIGNYTEFDGSMEIYITYEIITL